ncbi:MAG: RNA-binding S4 domain-containing protein [Acidobacteriota bacterium]|nr:RNA-binding S4 domain-containing protein [Acidobacteriota bacterium]
MPTNDSSRIDMWLKLVCLFKHRADATEACKGGHVKINGQRVKPAAPVKPGDEVEFYLGTHYRRVVVQSIPISNVSKEIARTMYVDETPVQPKVENISIRERGAGRPTKRDRREIEKLKQ